MTCKEIREEIEKSDAVHFNVETVFKAKQCHEYNVYGLVGPNNKVRGFAIEDTAENTLQCWE